MPVPVPSQSVVLRRYDPANESHVVIDQANGEKRFRSGALRWDEVDRIDLPGHLGCSVFDLNLLESVGLTQDDCLHDRTWRVARSTAQSIRDVRRDSSGSIAPFDLVADPTSQAEPQPIDPAHCLIVHAAPLSGAKKWYQRVASVFDL